jgi:glycosyltransferase involved in cell wall biosynthesis
MKTVVFYNSNKVWGGGEKWHFNMALALKNKGYKAFLITNPNSELEIKAKEAGIPTYPLPTSNLSFINPLKRIKLKLLLKKLNPQAVLMNLPSDVKICAPIAKSIGVKKVIYRRGMPHPIRNTKMNRYFYSHVDTIIANSEEIKRTVTKYIESLVEKTQIIYNGVIPQEHQPRTISSPVRLGNLGRLVEQKGQHHLIAVAEELKNQNIAFKLDIAGKGPLSEELREQINSKGLQEHINLVGHVNPSDFFHSLDLFVFTSHFEGSANALIESLQYGVPALAFNTSSNPEVLENDISGYLIEPFNELEMANKIIELIQSPEKYKAFQKNAIETIRTKFDYHEKIKQIESLIND